MTIDASIFADVPWVLVGAQMVMLLEREAGKTSGRTGDVDAMVDVRVLAGGTRAAAARLVAAGFEPKHGEHPYRFRRGAQLVDLLAPDHLGRRADLTTVPPGTTAEIPGGSRALTTRRVLSVRVAGVGSGDLPVPSLTGAIVLKVRAWEVRQAPRDAEDLVRLLGLVADIEVTRADLKAAERRSLGRVGPLADERGRAWRALADPDDARAAFARLSD
jgi:hypothetical protein